MPISKAVLAVERPTNSVVLAYGKNKDLYAVRQRIGCKRVDGRNIPITGPTIGHIVNFKYVPIANGGPLDISRSPIDLKDWANVRLCDTLFSDILDELMRVYSRDDSMKAYCIAIIRVCEPGIKNYEIKEFYDNSFLSETHPGVALSKNTVSDFLNDLGKTVSKIVSFMRNRAAKVSIDHHLLVDGTLKSDESRVNSLSDFSRKARTKGTRDISVLYAFDLEAMEPICSKCFPGNMLDITSYKSFLEENGIRKGIIVGDKGFPESAAHEWFEANPDLHHLNPIKRNSKLIERHGMLDFSGLLPGYDGITYRKEKCPDGKKWLYSFRDSHGAAKEERDFLAHAGKKGNYSLDDLRERQRTFGVIVLESDLDLPPEVVYKVYEKRWEIEVVMRFYKSACEFDETRVQDDYSVIGSEFCDFLATLLTFRLIKSFDKARLLEAMPYKKVMSILSRAKKVRPDGKEWRLVRMNPSQEDVLVKLDLLPKKEEPANGTPKRGRGRPKGSKTRG